MSKRYIVTSALPYANGALHLGHLAGAYLPADIYVRYLRLIGKDVVWVCGSDEHGAAITIRAKKEGISPQEIIDKYHNLNKQTFKELGISFDIYHRTSTPMPTPISNAGPEIAKLGFMSEEFLPEGVDKLFSLYTHKMPCFISIPNDETQGRFMTFINLGKLTARPFA